jgi:hypothetical protein
LITLVIGIIIALIAIAGRLNSAHAQTYQVRNPKGCISIFDSTIYIHLKKDSVVTQLNIQKRFVFKGSEHFKISSGKYSGFFVMNEERAFLIVAGNKTGEHFKQWYFFKKR